MKIIRSFVGAAVAAAALAMASPSSAEEVTLAIGSVVNADNPTARAMEIFKAEVARRSHNMIQVELGPDMKFGGANEILQKVRAGTIFATWTPIAYVTKIVAEAEVVNLPFVFDRYEDLLRVLDGPVGKLIESKLEAKGFTTLAWMDFGARSVMNAKRPLKTLDDFKNLRLRLLPMENLVATFRAFGVTPVTIDPKDVAGALKNGDIDGVELTYSIMNGYGNYESQKYVSDTKHLLDSMLLLASKTEFSRLSSEHRQILRDAARIAAAQELKMIRDAEAAALADLEAKGLQFDPVPAKTRVAMRKVAAGVINRMKGALGAELVNMVMAEASRNSGAMAGR
jgi:TRAP-type transport system periplasmic protein